MQNGGSAAAPVPAQGSGSQQTANVFTAEQLHVLRNQILAFRLVKVCQYQKWFYMLLTTLTLCKMDVPGNLDFQNVGSEG